MLYSLFLFSLINVFVSESPSLPCTKSDEKCTKVVTYDLLHRYYFEFLFLTYISCLAFLNIASELIQSTRFINLDTCLDYLPKSPESVKSKSFPFSYIFSDVTLSNYRLNFLLLITIPDNLSRLTTEFLIFIFKIYKQSFVNLFSIYKAWSPKLSFSSQGLMMKLNSLIIFLQIMNLW